MGVSTLLNRAALEYADGLAVIDATSGEQISYAELFSRARRVAAGLAAKGLRPGDRVGIMGLNSSRWVQASVALALGGFIQFPLPVNGASGDDIRRRLELVDASAVFVDAPMAAELLAVAGERTVIDMTEGSHQAGVRFTFDELLRTPEIPPAQAYAPHPEDQFCIRFTSGSTGVPKGVIHTQAAYAEVADNQLHVRNWGPYFSRDDRFLIFLPIESALQFLYSSLIAGVPIVLLDGQKNAHMGEAILAHQVTMTFGAPPVLTELLRASDPSATWPLQTVFYGGAAMPSSLEADLRSAFGDVFVHIYAASEFPGCALTRRRGEPASEDGSCGRPAFGFEARVIDVDGAPLDDGEIGELEVRGGNTFVGYWANAEATRDTIRSGGWVRSGDLARRDENGRYYIVDRQQNKMILNEQVIYPSEIERDLSGVEGCLEVVVAVDRRNDGDVLAVACHGQDDGVSERLQERLSDRGFRCEVVMFGKPFPKSAVGKILRQDVLALLDSARVDGGS